MKQISRQVNGTLLRCALLIFALIVLASMASAQVTLYTDEASFNAATANLNFVLETYEGIAPVGSNGYPANLVAPGADIFSPFSVSNADVYTTSTPQYLEVDDAAFNKISLNGSASLTVTGKFGAGGVGTSAVTMTTDNSATMAFGTDFGQRDPFGPGVYDTSHGGPATYPLTDTVDIQLYYYNYADLTTTPVGGVFHAGSLADGYLGFVSTQPFNRVTYTVSHTVNLYDGNRYVIADPYQMTWDNSRFGSAPLSPSYLYVSDFAAAEVYGYSNAGAQNEFTNSLVNPVGLAFDSAGNIYEADSGSGIIYKSTLSGKQTVFAQGFDRLLGLAFDASGNLFAANVDADNVGSIIKLTPAGVQSTFATGLTRVRGLAFDTSGNLYEAELDTGSISKFTPAGVKSTFAAGFNYPTGLAFDATGNLFVCSQGVGVFKVTPAGAVSTFTTNVTDPRYLAFDATGNLFVTDVGDATGTPGQGNVYRFAPDGTRTTFASNLAFPSGIAVAPSTTVAAPVITSAGSASAQVSAPFAYQIAASNAPTSFSASGLPSGLSVNTTGLIAGTPTQTGIFQISLTASNAGGAGTATLTLSVAAAPVVAPAITSGTTASAQAGNFFSYQITATNTPTSFNASGLPTGLSVNASTGLINGTPTATGVFTVALSATNSGGTGTAILSLTVAAAPMLAPVVTSARSATAQQGQPFGYQIAASNSPTSFAATGLPIGLSVNAVGSISGTPTQAGAFSIMLSATNGGGTGTAVLTLTVVEALPVASLMATTPTVTVGSGDIGEFTLSLSEAQSSDVQVNLLIKGSGINGTDYVLLKTTKKIKAGKTSKPIKVIPQGDLGGASKKTVVLELAPGDGYSVGTTGKVKVKIIGGE